MVDLGNCFKCQGHLQPGDTYILRGDTEGRAFIGHYTCPEDRCPACGSQFHSKPRKATWWDGVMGREYGCDL